MTTLESWENSLKQQMAEIDLIGKLGLTQKWTREIGILIRIAIRRSSAARHATLVLRTEIRTCEKAGITLYFRP